jgi:hypothetical protein
MNTTETTWIKMSERKPVEADFSAHKHVVCLFDGYSVAYNSLGDFMRGNQSFPCTHWQLIEIPPPPRELTQREKDEAQAQDVVKEYLYTEGLQGGYLTVARLAIHRERGEIQPLLDEVIAKMDETPGNFFNKEWFIARFASLRARLEEQGGK